jgi:hypothetical protein
MKLIIFKRKLNILTVWGDPNNLITGVKKRTLLTGFLGARKKPVSKVEKHSLYMKRERTPPPS